MVAVTILFFRLIHKQIGIKISLDRYLVKHFGKLTFCQHWSLDIRNSRLLEELKHQYGMEADRKNEQVAKLQEQLRIVEEKYAKAYQENENMKEELEKALKNVRYVTNVRELQVCKIEGAG